MSCLANQATDSIHTVHSNLLLFLLIAATIKNSAVEVCCQPISDISVTQKKLHGTFKKFPHFYIFLRNGEGWKAIGHV